ncbi:hypothetical protein ADL26_19160, partial [Thermoactinomyces vulgaris]
MDGILGLEALNPWDFRKLVGYLIRSQADYHDVFQLHKFMGKHSDWKPFVAHILGMTSESALELYAHRDKLEQTTDRIKTVVQEWGSEQVDISTIDGIIAVKRQ